MLHVILTILKLIGILIVVILGLLLLIILTVLFVPLRYKVKGKKYEEMSGAVKICWLFHIVSAYITYENEELVYKLKVFGFPIVNSLKDDTEEKEENKKREKSYKKRRKHTHTGDYIYDNIDITDDDNEDVIQIQSIKSLDKPDIITQTDVIAGAETQKDVIAAVDAKTDVVAGANTSRKINHKKNRHNNIIRKISSKIKLIFLKIKSIILKIRDTIIGIYNKTINLKESITDKIKVFNETINTEENKKLLKFLISQIKIILKHIAPRKYKIFIKYGASEPDVTGKVISYVAIANAFFNIKLNFLPVFDEEIFEGELYLRGRIRVFTMLIIAFRVYRNKQFKKMIKKYM